MNLQSRSVELAMNVLYYSFLAAIGSFVFYIIFSSLNDLMKLYYMSNLNIMEMEYKLKSFSADVLSSVQNTLNQRSPSPENSFWSTWLRTVVVSLTTLTVRYLVGLCCHLLPAALFKITLLGPCLKFIILGPEAFFVEQLDPNEIRDRFNFLSEAGQSLNENCETRNRVNTDALNAVVTAMDELRAKMRVLETGSSIDTINISRPITHEAAISEANRTLEGISGSDGGAFRDQENRTTGIFGN